MKQKQVPVPKPRNPVVGFAVVRSGAGVHDKPNKVKRAADKKFIKGLINKYGSIDPE